MKTKPIRLLLFFTLLLLINAQDLCGQSENKFILGDDVGTEIDEIECIRYDFFPDVKNLLEVTITITKGEYYLWNFTKTDTGTDKSVYSISLDDVIKIRNYINDFEENDSKELKISDLKSLVRLPEGIEENFLPPHVTSITPDSTIVYLISMQDDSRLYATILDKHDSSISIKTISGIKIELDYKQIYRIEKVEGNWIDGKFIEFERDKTRMFFFPSAKTNSAPGGFISWHELFFVYVEVGILDRLSFGIGGIPYPPSIAIVRMFTGKYNFFSTEQIDLAISFFTIKLYNTNSNVIYGLASYTGEKGTLTLGMGGWSNGKNGWGDKPFLLLGAKLKVSKITSLISENWMNSNTDGIIMMLGIRFSGRDMSLDISALTETGLLGQRGHLFILPWLALTYKF